jgi:transformation/transcription domain-associated protein
MQGPDELIVLGLRTLEVWVDNFNPEYVEVAISEVSSMALV